MTRRTSGYWLAGIVVVGALLRFHAIGFGLPYPNARPDEDVAMGVAAAMLKGDLNPRFFHWPSLTFYVLAALYAIASAVRRALSLDPALTFANYVLVARAFVAFAGTLTILVLFSLARRSTDATIGLLAALFLAVTILHVRESHFAMTDVLMTLLLTTSLAMLLRALDPALQTRALGWFAAAGATGGLAASTKYSAAAVVAAMAAAELVWVVRLPGAPWRPRVWAPAALFLGAFALGFVAGTPYSLLDHAKFAADVQFDLMHLSQGHGVSLGRGWSYHLTVSLPHSVSVPVFVAAIAGVVPFARHYPRDAIVLGTFAVAFFASVGSGQTVFFRYVLPLVPIACLLAAIGVRHGGAWLASRTGFSSGAVTALLAVTVSGPAFVNSAWFDIVLARTDTRVLASQWLRPRLLAEESVHDAGIVYTRLDLSGARFQPWGADPAFDPTSPSFGQPAGRIPDWLVLYDSPLQLYAQTPAPLRDLAKEKYDLAFTARGVKDQTASAVYDLQDAFFLPVSGLATVERPGPTISIYRRKD